MVNISISLPHNSSLMANYLLAILNNRSFSNWVARVIESHYEAHMSGNPKREVGDVDIVEYLDREEIDFVNLVSDLEEKVGSGDSRLRKIKELGESNYLDLRKRLGLSSS